MNLKKKVLTPDSPGAQMSGTEMSSAQTEAPKRTRPQKKTAQALYIPIVRQILH